MVSRQRLRSFRLWLSWTVVAIGLSVQSLHAREFGLLAQAVLVSGSEETAAPSAAGGEAPASSSGGKQAGSSLLDMDLDSLANVKVQNRPDASSKDAPSSMLSRDNQSYNDAQTTGDILEKASSVSLRRTSALNLDPMIRGYNSQQIRASANGMTQYKTRVDIDSLFSQIDPGIVERINVIDGPYSSLHGPGFAFLVADLFGTPRYKDGPQFHGSTHLGYGSNASGLYVRQNAYGGGQNWGAYLSYGQRSADDYITGGGQPYRIPSSYDKWDGFMSLGLDLSRFDRIEINYIHNTINDLELPGVVYDLNKSVNDQFNLRYVVQPDARGPERFVMQYWLDQTSYQGDASRASKQQTLYEDFFTIPSFDELPMNTIGQGFSDSMGLRAYTTFGEQDHVLWTLGTDWRRVDQRYEELNLDGSGDLIFGGNLYGIPESRQDDIGFFAHTGVTVNEVYSFSFGARYDHVFSELNDRDQIITAIDDPADFSYLPGYEEPKHDLGMVYLSHTLQLTEHAALSAGTAYAMRNPSLAELYSDEPYVPAIRFGNSYLDGMSSLDEEEALQCDLGFRVRMEEFEWGIRGFYTTIHDYILTAPAGIDPSPPVPFATNALDRDFSGFPDDFRQDLIAGSVNADTAQAGYQYVNIDRASLFGGDLHAGFWLRPGLQLHGTMSYVQGTNHAPVQVLQNDPIEIVRLPGSDPLPNIYPINGIVGIRLVQPESEKWGMDFLCRIAGTQHRVARTLGELPTRGFAVFGLRGYVQAREHLRLTMTLDNLFNVNYRQHGSLAIIGPNGLPTFLQEPGFNGLFGMEWSF